MITPNQAQRLFLEVGKGRTLRKVKAALREQHGNDTPSLKTLGQWSAEGGWVRAAEEWDGKDQAGPTPERRLTPKQQRFVDEYLVDLNSYPGRDSRRLQRQDG